jgi:GTP-binding protein
MSIPRQVRFLQAAARADQYPPEQLPEVAFAGRSNVGKSALINTLVGRKGLARISQTPGKTQLIHFYQAEDRFLLVDLPGYGYARVPEGIRKRWGPMVERYLAGRRSLRLVIFLLDLRRTPSQLDLQLKGWLDHHAIPTCFVLTKADKVSRGSRLPLIRQIADALEVTAADLIPFSAVTREGRRELWGVVLRAVSPPAYNIK